MNKLVKQKQLNLEEMTKHRPKLEDTVSILIEETEELKKIIDFLKNHKPKLNIDSYRIENEKNLSEYRKTIELLKSVLANHLSLAEQLTIKNDESLIKRIEETEKRLLQHQYIAYGLIVFVFFILLFK